MCVAMIERYSVCVRPGGTEGHHEAGGSHNAAPRRWKTELIEMSSPRTCKHTEMFRNAGESERHRGPSKDLTRLTMMSEGRVASCRELFHDQPSATGTAPQTRRLHQNYSNEFHIFIRSVYWN